MKNEINEIEYPSLSGSKKVIDIGPYIKENIEKFDGYQGRIEEILGNFNQPNTLSISKNEEGKVTCDVALSKNEKSTLSFYSEQSEEEIVQSIINAGVNRIAAHVQHNRSFRAGDVHGVPTDSSVFEGYRGVAMEGLERFASESRLPYSLSSNQKEYDLSIQKDDVTKTYKRRLEDVESLTDSGKFYKKYTYNVETQEDNLKNKIKDFLNINKKPENEVRRPRP